MTTPIACPINDTPQEPLRVACFSDDVVTAQGTPWMMAHPKLRALALDFFAALIGIAIIAIPMLVIGFA